MPQNPDLEKQYSTVKKNYLKFLDLLNKANAERFTNPDQYSQFMQTIAQNGAGIQSLYDNYYGMRDQVTQARKDNDNTIITGLRSELEKMPTMQQPPVSIASEPRQTTSEVQQPMMTGQVKSTEPMMSKQEPMMSKQQPMQQSIQQTQPTQTMQAQPAMGQTPTNSAAGGMLTTLDTPQFKPKGYSVRL